MELNKTPGRCQYIPFTRNQPALSTLRQQERQGLNSDFDSQWYHLTGITFFLWSGEIDHTIELNAG